MHGTIAPARRFARVPQRGGWAAAAAQALVEQPALLALLMVAVALAARAAQFGNPVIQVDDEFYLLVGDRMLHGALPYVDIWDRKPVGLFLLYAGIRLLGGTGVIAYQLVATMFAAATAFAIARIARRFASAHGAAAAGVVYLVWLGVFGGEGGQSPVFYNLLVAGAALLVLRACERPEFDARALTLGGAAMLAIGLSLQIKYSTVFEGAFFGLALLWHGWRRGAGRAELGAAGLLWASLAAAPTGVAWAVYAAAGHADAFVQANFLSILERGTDGAGPTAGRLFWMTLKLSPLLAAAWLARGSVADAGRNDHRFVQGWALAAIGGVLLFGSYFDHYALPLLVPLAAAAAPLFADRRAGLRIVATGSGVRVPAGVAVMAVAIALSVPGIDKNRRDRGWGPQVEAMAEFIRPRLQGGCLYVYHGEPSLYRMTGSCLPTRWPFPNHLNYSRESLALGVDALAETQRILATRPAFVVTSTRPERSVNRATWNAVEQAVARDYVLALRVPVGSRERLVYQRRPDR